MRNAIITIVAALALAGCGKDSDTPSASEGDKILADLEAHRDAVCGCADKECALAAGEKAAAFEEEVKSKFKSPTPEQREKFASLADELKECLRR